MRHITSSYSETNSNKPEREYYNPFLSTDNYPYTFIEKTEIISQIFLFDCEHLESKSYFNTFSSILGKLTTRRWKFLIAEKILEANTFLAIY